MRFLPFYARFRAPILEGTKTKTARTRKYGEPGDILETPFCRIRLLEVARVEVGDVAEHHWQAEGVASPGEFREVWAQIHPRRGFVATDRVWLHSFEVTA